MSPGMQEADKEEYNFDELNRPVRKYFYSLQIIDTQRSKKNIRKEYKYIEATESFYQFHTTRKNWEDARDVCKMEGATFYYPGSQAEADAVGQFWNETQSGVSSIYIGVSSWVVKGVFDTVDGRSITDVCAVWAPGEPNNGNGNEDCALMRRDGTLNDVNCNDKNPFLCKKTLNSLEWDAKCDVPNPDYVFDAYLGKCYKIHLEQKTWPEAYAACSAEQSYLAVINSQAEADHLVAISTIEIKDIAQDNFMCGSVLLGFHQRRGEWTTNQGTKLVNSGYSKWGFQQPEGGEKETCGAMFYNGYLQDVKCDIKSYFICEHDVANLVHDGRFGGDTGDYTSQHFYK